MQKYTSSFILGILISLMTGSALWSPGGIMLLDYVGTDHAAIPWFKNAWFLIPQIPISLFGYEVGSKLVFVGILLLAGYFGHILGGTLAKKYFPSTGKTLEVFGGIFFLINPFAYERMMTQPVIFLACIMLGFSIYMLLFKQSGKYLYAGLFAAISISLMPHASYMVLVIFIVYSIFFSTIKQTTTGGIKMFLIILGVNLNWIFPQILDMGNTVSIIQNFSIENLVAFQSNAIAPMNVWGTNILLYGFWGERFDNHSINVKFLSSLWYIAGMILFAVVILGYYRLWKIGEKRIVFMLGGLSIFSLVFAIGIASPITKSLTLFLVEYLPFWQGYREPQKWVAVLMIIEGIGFLLGFAFILERWGYDKVLYASIIFCTTILFFVWSPGTLLGYHYQLKTTIFPDEFEQIRQTLIKNTNLASDQKILALPWHSYIGCNWTGRPTISNPIKGLLSPINVISSDNIEISNILYSNSKNIQSLAVEEFMLNNEFSSIKKYGFTHILLMKNCINSGKYNWIESIPQCKKSYSGNDADLYFCN